MESKASLQALPCMGYHAFLHAPFFFKHGHAQGLAGQRNDKLRDCERAYVNVCIWLSMSEREHVVSMSYIIVAWGL